MTSVALSSFRNILQGPEEVRIKESVNKSIEHFPPAQPKEIICTEVLRGQSKCMRQHKVQVMFILMDTIFQELKLILPQNALAHTFEQEAKEGN